LKFPKGQRPSGNPRGGEGGEITAPRKKSKVQPPKNHGIKVSFYGTLRRLLRKGSTRRIRKGKRNKQA